MTDALNRFASLFTPPAPAGGGRMSFCIPSLTGCADAFLAAALARPNKIVLVVTPGLPDADRLFDDLSLVTAREPTRVLEFPPLLDNDKSSLGLRLKAIAALRAWPERPYPAIVVATCHALAQPIPASASPLRLSISHATNRQSGGFSALASQLAKFGYNRVSQVEQEGDFSVRGGIIDAWSPGDEFPTRAEFFGEDLESIRTFSPATQISIAPVECCEFLPANLSDDSGASPPSSPSLLASSSLLPPESSIVLALEHNDYSISALQPLNAPIIYAGDPAPRGIPGYAFQTTPLPGFAELGADEAHHPELFDAARKCLDQHLAAAQRRHAHILRADDLSGGFEVGDLVVVTKSDRVFAKRTRRRTSRGSLVPPSSPRTPLSDFEDLEPGEYVVHVDHGVGRYIGSSEILVDGKRSEVFTVEYANGGKLHIPAAHAHLLSRYVGVKGEAVRLHRLDGTRWEKDKRDAQRAVTDLAAALLETQARRETVPGLAYDVACEGLEAFEAAFPFEETPDQAAAIAAVKKDLANQKPMDRLICGDAGYGKTEVAMRAAYVAAMNGKQVAVLAPTTVLAEQHFETFTSRFDGTPIRIESCSRFQSALTHRGTFRRIATGACDIVIGTHAILSPKICFHDLGLIIIDEEQRFGVRHKEFLKRLRTTADVLTLSATPIPRTLYLSMTGARDLSLLRSPPRERVAVETHVVRDSDEIVRSAIEAEMLRGGQVYFLHNRVTDIGRAEKRIRALFSHPSETSAKRPAPRIVVAHGQMDARTLARKMRDFERGEYDILLSTTIVESGIDIPRANTILVDQAHTFGMADLYQLRGRVGRSSRQGHAYFLLPPLGTVDEEARERLDALRRHGGLGGGFNLAVRDLELRGAGNLLGSQQSGHIAAVGFQLYCQLLQRTIALLKGEKPKEVIDVVLNLDFTAPRLPYDYIEEDVQRLSLMKRFAEAQDKRVVTALAEEMRDRFGPLPPEAAEYVRIAELRVACAQAGIARIDANEMRAVLYRHGSHDIYRVIDLRGRTAEARIRELIRSTRSPKP